MLAELTGEHAVDRIGRHAQEHPQRDQGKQPDMLGQGGDQRTQEHGNDGGGKSHLIGGGAARREALHQGAQQVLEVRLELVNGGHGQSPLPGMTKGWLTIAILPGWRPRFARVYPARRRSTP